MRVLIAVDSFKHALDAPSVCSAIAAGLRQQSQRHELVEFPLADGGEGTVDVLIRALHLAEQPVDSVDALNRSLQSCIGFNASSRIAAVELAQSCGVQRLTSEERNPMRTTTLGAGLDIAAAITSGAERILFGIGGSATTDGGIGLATALGWKFIDGDNRKIEPVGGRLLDIRTIVPPAHNLEVAIDVLCDVDNPLFGPSGAAYVFAKQKGANENEIAMLDAGLRHLAALVEKYSLARTSPDTPSAGAAGGLGYGAMVFLKAKLRRGAQHLLDLTKFEAALSQTDLVITGEGRIDGQTLRGKLVHEVCRRAAQRTVPVIALCGQLSATPDELKAIGLSAAYSINDGFPPDDALPQTAERLTRCATKLTLTLPLP